MQHELLLQAVIYLLAAVVAVPLARRLGLGAVLGYLLAGAAIGPWGLGLIGDVEAILHVSEFGVVLLLFVIGLELEPHRLWSLRRAIFGWGTAQVLGSAAVLAGAALLAGIGWPVALVAALGLALSSTAIALGTMEERRMLDTPAGQAGFSVLLFQDIAAIPMIALVPVLGDGGAHAGPGWLRALQIVGVIAALVVGGRLVVCPALDIIGRIRMREIFTAFALLLVIAIALVMQWFGMSMALGAFLAGVLLAHSEYRHEMESDLEPFKGLLLGLFFIAVGMSVDFGLLATRPWLVIGLACAFVALKLAVLVPLALAAGLRGRQAMLFAVLLAQGGEFAFVVFGAAAQARTFDAATAALLVLVVTLSMLVSPLLLLAAERLLAPRLAQAADRPRDGPIDPGGAGHVIIAGFGRFGQIVGRLLIANQVPLTILDHDPDNVDVVTVFGFKVFYGDATRADLLQAAGAETARALVVAIDNVDDSLKLVGAARQQFPGLPILARARNLTHAYQLMDLGVTLIERETFESALLLGRRTLEQLGFGARLARRAAQRFRSHNLRSLHAAYPYYKDREQYVFRARQARAELHDMFERDFAAIRRAHEDGGD